MVIMLNGPGILLAQTLLLSDLQESNTLHVSITIINPLTEQVRGFFTTNLVRPSLKKERPTRFLTFQRCDPDVA
jgi:hypothetical protein